MCLNKFAKVIYTPGTASEHTHITIYMHYDTERYKPLWSGEAKDLAHQDYLSDFMVVEMLVDNDPKFDHLPDYNKGKIITVV